MWTTSAALTGCRSVLPITHIADPMPVVYDPDNGDWLLSPVLIRVVPSPISCTDLGSLGFNLSQQTSMKGWDTSITAVYNQSTCVLNVSHTGNVTAFNTTAVQGALFRIGMCFPATPPSSAAAILAASTSFSLGFIVTLSDACAIAAPNSYFPGERANCTLTTLANFTAGQYVAVTGGPGDAQAVMVPATWSPAGLTEGAGPTSLAPTGPGAWTIGAPNVTINGCSVAFLSGTCSPGADTLSLSGGAIGSLYVAANVAGNPYPQGFNLTCGGSAPPIVVSVQAPGSAYAALLSSVTFQSSTANSLPGTARRGVEFACGVGLVNGGAGVYDSYAYALFTVAPVNQPPTPPTVTTIVLAENAPPIVEVSVAASCGGRVGNTSAAASLCFSDPDPIVLASPVSPGGELVATVYNLSMATPSGPMSWTAAGSPSFDCSARLGAAASLDLALSAAPTPCWRQRFTVAASPFDYEAMVSGGFISFTLTVIDTLVGVGSASISTPVSLSITDVDDPAGIAFAPSVTQLVFDDSAPGPSNAIGPSAPMYITDQDVSDKNNHSITLVAVNPPDGSPALNGLTASQLFAAVQSSPATLYSGSTQLEGWTLRSLMPLGSLPAKTILLNATVVSLQRTPSSTGVSLSIPVRLTRNNSQPAFPSSSQYNFMVGEFTSTNTSVGQLSAADADTNQALTYAIVWCGGPLPICPFSLAPVSVPTMLRDYSSVPSVNTSVSVPRSAQLEVGVDSLDYHEMLLWGSGTGTTFNLTIGVTDNAALNSSALPAVLPLSASVNVTVTVTQQPSDGPNVTSVTCVPGGACGAVSGGVVLAITGNNLGLPGSAPGSVSGLLWGGSLGSRNLSAISINCTVATRLTGVQCTVPPGVGVGYSLSLNVSGQPATLLMPVPFSLSYALPMWTGTSTMLFHTQGNDEFSVQASGLARLNYSVVLEGGDGTPREMACISPTDGGNSLACTSPEGAGAGYIPSISINGIPSLPSLLSYEPPVITGLTQLPELQDGSVASPSNSPTPTGSGSNSASNTATMSRAGSWTASQTSTSSVTGSFTTSSTPASSSSSTVTASVTAAPTNSTISMAGSIGVTRTSTSSSTPSFSGSGSGTANVSFSAAGSGSASLTSSASPSPSFPDSSTSWYSSDPLAFLVSGTNLGNDATLDWVAYSFAKDDKSSWGCGRGGGGIPPAATCGLLLAKNCTFYRPHRSVACLLDSAAYGVGFYVKVGAWGLEHEGSLGYRVWVSGATCFLRHVLLVVRCAANCVGEEGALLHEDDATYVRMWRFKGCAGI